MSWRPWAFAIGFVILVLVAALVMWPRDNIFTLDLSTEVAAFRVTDPILSQWSVGSADLIENPFIDVSQARQLNEFAHLIIYPGTRVQLQRQGVGSVRIKLTTTNQQSVGRIEQSTGDIELGDWSLLLIMPDEQSLVFPFRGTLDAGDDVTAGVDSLLLDGTVSVVEEQILGKTHYTAGTYNLDTGDRVLLLRHEPSLAEKVSAAKVSGFVRAEPMGGFSEPVNALQLVAHGQADYVKIERLGSAGYQIRAPRWARFLHDPFLAAVTAIIALFVLLIELVSKCGALKAPADQSDNKPTNGPQLMDRDSNEDN